jgi:hypothetical protein
VYTNHIEERVQNVKVEVVQTETTQVSKNVTPQIRIVTNPQPPQDTEKLEFDSSERFNEELLSQLPVDPFKKPSVQREVHVQSGNNNTLTTQNRTVRSNFTYGKNSNNEMHEFKSELLGEPLPNEERVRRRSHKRQITKEEFEKLKMENQGQTVVRTVRRVSMNVGDEQEELKTTSRSRSPLRVQGKISENAPVKYLKLVTDENGKKSYQMVMGNEVIRNLSPSRSSQNQGTVQYSEPKSSGRFGQDNVTRNVVRVSSNQQSVYNTVTSEQMNTYSSHKQEIKMTQNKYNTYSYTNTRFGNGSHQVQVKNSGNLRALSPSRGGTEPRVLRKSPSKVVMYKDGVKLMERRFDK